MLCLMALQCGSYCCWCCCPFNRSQQPTIYHQFKHQCNTATHEPTPYFQKVSQNIFFFFSFKHSNAVRLSVCPLRFSKLITNKNCINCCCCSCCCCYCYYYGCRLLMFLQDKVVPKRFSKNDMKCIGHWPINSLKKKNPKRTLNLNKYGFGLGYRYGFGYGIVIVIAIAIAIEISIDLKAKKKKVLLQQDFVLLL